MHNLPGVLHRVRPYLPLFAALLLGTLTLCLLGAVNVTWDEALGDFFFGQRNLSFFTSFDAKYLDFAKDPYPQDHTPDLTSSAFRNRPWEHPPAMATLAAATSAVLSNGLGIMDPFDGFHALNAFLAAFLLFAFWRFLEPRYGSLVAVAAVTLLFSMPRVFAHLLANIKDFPLMVLFSMSLMFFVSGYERGSKRRMLVAGVLWGLALATRPNALFLPMIVVGVVLVAKIPRPWQNRKLQLATTMAGAGVAGLMTLFLSWPYLWAEPITRYLEHLQFLTGRHATTRAESLAPALQALLLTTPPLVLALFVVGLLPLAKKLRQREPNAWLLLLWLLNIPLRYLLPGAINYDGVRHFLEIFPPIAAIAALGLAIPIRRMAAEFKQPTRARAGLLVVALLPGMWLNFSTHPFQIAYWNSFAGGSYGAWHGKRPQAGDYWGLSYRQGLRWLNDNAPQGSAVAVPVIEHAVRMVAPQRLRDDLGLLALTTPYSPELRPQWRKVLNEVSATRTVFIMMVPRRDWMNELMTDSLNQLEPVAKWELNSAPMLLIYQWPTADGTAGQTAN